MTAVAKGRSAFIHRSSGSLGCAPARLSHVHTPRGRITPRDEEIDRIGDLAATELPTFLQELDDAQHEDDCLDVDEFQVTQLRVGWDPAP